MFQFHNGSSSGSTTQADEAAVATAAELLLGTTNEEEQEHQLLLSSSSSDFYNYSSSFNNIHHQLELDDDFFINNLLFPSSSSSSSTENIFSTIDVHNSNDFYHFNYSNTYPKRQKIDNDHQLVLLPPSSSSDFVTSLNHHHHSLLLDYAAGFPMEQPQIPIPPQLLPLPSFFPAGDNSQMSKRTNNDVENVSLSAQSVAARQRRRKISEKTHQLGKLIPGASWNNSTHKSNSKMNTADMFQAAFKYVKFLQAQVGILELMHEERNNKGSFSSIDLVLLEVLLTSSTMQEKLYSEEKCLVTNDFLEVLKARDGEIQESYPLISKDLNSLLVVHHHEHLESTTTTTTTT